MVHWANALRVAARPSRHLSLLHAANTQKPFYTASARRQPYSATCNHLVKAEPLATHPFLSPKSCLYSLFSSQKRCWRHASDQRQKDEDDSQRSHVPYEGAQQKNARCIQGKISDATPKIELDTPLGHPTVRGRNMRY